MHIVKITDQWFGDEFLRGHSIYTSLEGENAGGSIKDIMVKSELENLLQSGCLKPGDAVSELSAGSTALSLAHYCRSLGLKAIIYLPNTVPAELIGRLEALEAQVELLDPESAYPDYERLTEGLGCYRFNQLFDESKKSHYRSAGQLILRKLPQINAMIGAVGTGHSLLGLASAIKNLEIISAEPSGQWKISGCRNIDVDRYGELDSCRPEQFSQRIRLGSPEDLFPETSIECEGGIISVTDSFRLVLAAAKIYLADKKGRTIFVVGAANRRIRASEFRHSA